MSSNYIFRIMGVVFVAGLCTSNRLLAQTTTSTTAPDHEPAASDSAGPGPAAEQALGDRHHRRFDFLSHQDRKKLKLARESVLEKNPELQTEEEELKKEGKALHANPKATNEERKAFFAKLHVHMEAVKTAILEQDPSLQPIFDQIDEHMKDWHQNHSHPADPAPPDNPNPPTD